MKITENCVNLLRTLPLLLHDGKIPGDVATKPHEITHAPDALRYFASYRAFAPETKKDEKKAQKLSEKLRLR